MPITHQPGTTLAFQQQFRPIGRIRTGIQVEFTRKNGSKGKRPGRLETFALTSADVEMLERAQAIYGGEIGAWPEAPDGDSMRLITEARELEILVPSGQPLSQWYELWSGGGCARRCTGAMEMLSGGPCVCPSDPTDRMELAGKGEACKPTTRVNVLLPEMDLGAWMLVTHSFYAAMELPPVVSTLAQIAEFTGRPSPARLWIDQRHVKRQGQPPKDFPVPAIRTALSWATLLSAGPVAAGPMVTPGNGRVHAQLPAGDTPLPDDPEPTRQAPASAPPTGHAATPEPAADADTAPEASAAPGASVAVGGPVPMDPEEFRTFLEVERIATDYAKAVAGDLFPGVARMTDAQRGELAAALTKED